MIEVRDAVQKAREIFLALHTDANVSEVELAEVALSDDDRFWSVTFAYRDDEVSGISKHKVLQLDADSGQVRSITIRVL